MRSQVGRSLHYYYVTLIIFTLIIFGVGSKYFWDHGPFNSENVRASYEASLKYDDLRERNPLSQVDKLVNSDRARDGMNRLISVEKEISEMDNYGHVPTIDSLNLSIKHTTRYLNQLISYPQMNNVMSVLANKVASFENYVSENHWRTLTRISRRIKSQVSPGVIKSPGFYRLRKLSKFSSRLNSEIKRMEKITMASLLTIADKQNIVTKLRTFDAELRMLGRYVKSLKGFQGSFKALQASYKIWLDETAPQITLT